MVSALEEAPEEANVQYPLIAAPSVGERIDFVIVSEEKYCIFDGEKYGFIAEDEEEIALCIYDIAYPFSEGLAFFSIDGRYGYIDQNDQIAIEPVFDDAGYFKEKLAKVMKDGRYGIINRDGTFIVDLEYDAIAIDGSDSGY